LGAAVGPWISHIDWIDPSTWLTWNVLVVAIFHATAPPRRRERHLSSKSSKSFRHVDRPEICIPHAAKLIKNAILKVYAGGSHGLSDTHKNELNTDLLAFVAG
jgi:hypothetical protein